MASVATDPGYPWRRPRPVAPYAADAACSAGRLVPEPACPMRTPFQRDRDRILHATAFRRLTYKTQVFLFHEGDHYRTRLTHTLEVAQIARSIARLLGLDEDLAEAIALAHDLGHPPFGHAGERALHAAMRDYGGFDHNAQSFKIVTALERKYAAFDGLNLAIETLEGLVKHNGPLVGEGAKSEGGGTPVLLAAIRAAGHEAALSLENHAPAEAQAAAVADDIAYNNHDIDDGLRAGLISLADLADVPLAARFIADVESQASFDPARVIYEVNRRLITVMVADVAAEAQRRIAAINPQSVQDVRAAGQAVVDFSPQMQSEIRELKQFLLRRVYRHPKVMQVMDGAETIVRDLFGRYLDDVTALPGNRGAALLGKSKTARASVIADFVAGMTDRYAISEHGRLFDATPELR